MKYYEQMLTKWGFSDGDAMPAGVGHYRAAYILAVNSLAAALGSKVRLEALNGNGLHNWCLIVKVDAAAVADLKPEQLTEDAPMGRLGVEPEADEAMEEAILQAMELEIDSYVNCKVTLPMGSIKALLALKPVKEDQPQ